LTNGRCVHPELKKFNLIISGRDWCNLYEEITQEQIDQMQEKAMQSEQWQASDFYMNNALYLIAQKKIWPVVIPGNHVFIIPSRV
jgi:hypothetical protein